MNQDERGSHAAAAQRLARARDKLGLSDQGTRKLAQVCVCVCKGGA